MKICEPIFRKPLRERIEEELKKRLELFKEATKDYRHAMAILVCESTIWKGDRTEPENLPQEEKDRLAEIRKKGWELNVKIEDLK